MEKKFKLLENDTCTLNGHKLYRIQALKDFRNVSKGDLGGWVEKEENLSHEGTCWVYDEAMVFNNAIVADDATVRNNARVYKNAEMADRSIMMYDAKLHGSAILAGQAIVRGNAEVFGNAVIADHVCVYDNAKIHDCAHIFNNAHVSGNAEVYGIIKVVDNVHICDSAQVHGIGGDICGTSKIFKNAEIYVQHRIDSAKIGKDAIIADSSSFITVGPIGSRMSYTTFYKGKSGNIMVCCGCFNDTIDEFEKKVKETHGNNELYLNQYTGAINMARLSFRF